jgi:GNAT superfamily N-acetyltransferase
VTELPTVQIGTPEDIHQLMALSAEACDENGFVVPKTEMILEQIWSALNGDAGLVGKITGPDGTIEGAILLRITKLFYSDQPVLEEKGIFVHPDYRSAKVGRARMLCEFAKRAAESLNIPLLIGVLSNTRTEAKIRLYKRQFGEPAGVFFLYNAKTGVPGSTLATE